MGKLSSLVGQDSLKQVLQTQIEYAISRTVALPHILLCGPPNRGKSTFAAAIADEIGSSYQAADARLIRKAGDLSSLLTNLVDGDILGIQDIDGMPSPLVEVLAPTLERYELALTIGVGSSARTIQLELPRFTLIGMTSKPSRVDERLTRWMTSYDLMPYSDGEMLKLLPILATDHNLTFSTEAAQLLIQHSEGSLGSLSVLLRKLSNFSHHAEGFVSLETATAALRLLGYQQTTMNSHDILKRVRAMSGVEFERFVAGIFQRQGYSAELTVASGDHGIDIILRKPGQVVAVQCKRWDNVIGEPVLRDFYGSVMNVGANMGFLVTSSSFTAQAEKFAENKPIRLYDVDAVIQLNLDTYGNSASETMV